MGHPWGVRLVGRDPSGGRKGLVNRTTFRIETGRGYERKHRAKPEEKGWMRGCQGSWKRWFRPLSASRPGCGHRSDAPSWGRQPSGTNLRVGSSKRSFGMRIDVSRSPALKGMERDEPKLSDSRSKIQSKDTLVGRVMNAQANFLRVIVTSEESEGVEERVELLCVVRALMKKMKRRVLVGDFVTVSGIDWVDGRGMVMDVLPRKGTMSAPPVANVDHVLLMFSLEEPRAEEAQISRFLIGSEACRLPVTVVLNKAELLAKEDIQKWVDKLEGWGYRAIPCSVKQNISVHPILKTLEGRTSVVAGPSGVGKSSLINAIWNLEGSPTGEDTTTANARSSPQDWEPVAVGEVSQRSRRGKHTTRHVTLLPLPGGGLLADTPGYSQPAEINCCNAEELTSCFPEAIRRLQEKGPCQFKDCRHVSEPGCSVRGDWERYPDYVTVLLEIEEREKKLLEQGRMKNESTVRYKDAKGGQQTVEAKLEPRKHRRESRKGARQKLVDLALRIEEEEEDYH